MSKSRVCELVNVLACILEDATRTFPTLGREFERDLNRLKSLVEARGLPLLLVDFPAVGKHLDRCIAGGHYSPSGLPTTSRRQGGEVTPVLYRGLYLMVFDEAGSLKASADPEAVFFLRQLLFVAKKVELDCGRKKTAACVQEFAYTDAQLPDPEGYWDAEKPAELRERHFYYGFRKSAQIRSRLMELPPERRGEVSAALTLLDKVSDYVASTLGAYNPREWRFKHGPGAIAETTKTKNKYSWSNWSPVLEDEFPISDYGYHSHPSWAFCSEAGDVSSEIPLSRLVAVPKSFKGPRLIAAEPSEHQWCQQNIWHYLGVRTQRSVLGRFLRFRSQALNQALCVEGSKDGALATLDLSEASDRVTCHVVGQMFRSNPSLLSALRATRTRGVTQKICRETHPTVHLKKFTTMGSACTFPVESLIFLSLALAAAHLKGGQSRVNRRSIEAHVGKVAVFGDDIIVPADCRELLCDLLGVLYFKVNVMKSFWEGNFRESCGVDSFRGVNVTPVYWKVSYDGKPESLASAVETRNNFYKKGLLATADYLASTLPGGLPWVHVTSGVFGLKTRLRPVNKRLKRRYNKDLHRVEMRCLTVKAKQTKSPVNDETALLQYFTEMPSPYDVWASGVAQRIKLKQLYAWVPEDSVEQQAN
jgi:hypothetical protein